MSAEKIKFLSLQMLGVCFIEVGGRTIDLRRKPKRLVKLLALQSNQRLHREQIVELLWADQEPEAAINNLHKTIHAARRAFEPDLISGGDSKFISTKEGQIILTAPDGLQIDFLDFETLAAEALRSTDEKSHENALAIYAGDLLPEDLYEDWTNERRESLRRSHRKLLHKLAALYESRAKFEQGAEVSRKLLALDELDEDAHRSLMRSLSLGGNRQQAVKQFEQCRAVLKKELDVEPENETRELFEQIVSGKFQPQTKQSQLSADLSGGKSSTPPTPRTNLPHQLTSFVGRAGEIAEIKNLLKRTRLLTLTGAGGIGKTRLALESAGELLDKFRDGVWFVELAALSDSSLVVRAAAAVLGVQEDASRPLTETLHEFLRSKQILLIFDNCEQIVGACAALVAELLKNCSELRVLATSREALDTSGEIVWSVPTLSLPSEIRVQTALADFADYEAVQLFIERARLVKRRFSLAANNAETIARLCRQLDGIPLAIELAAARVRVLSVEQITARLDNSLQLLTSGGRTTVPRHQTLRAAIDWSYEILSAPEQAMWRALAVFAGGFTLDAAEFVCAGLSKDDSILDLLTNLIDKSIVSASEREAETRYSMLETIRQYAAEKLRVAGEEIIIRPLHFDYFLQLAERAESEFSKPAQREWFGRVETELDNYRVALRWRVDAEKNAAFGLRLCNALYRFWQAHGYLSEARGWFAAALSLVGDDVEKPVRAEAFYRFGDLANLQGDFAEAQTAFEESVRLWREAGGSRVRLIGVVEQLAFVAIRLGDYGRAANLYGECLDFWRASGEQIGVARVLNGFGVLARYEGDYDLAASRLEEGLSIFRTLNHKYGLTAMMHNLGEAKLYQGDLIRAETLLEESLALAREITDKRWESYALTTLGNLAVERGDPQKALVNFKTALMICREIGEKPFVAFILEGFACAFAEQTDARRAYRFRGAATALRESLKMMRSPAEQAILNRHLDKTGVQNEATEHEYRAGRAMPLDAAVQFALQDE